MLVYFKSFDVSHDFSKTAALALVRNHVFWVNLTIYQSMYDSNQFVFQQIKRVNDEKRLLRIFRCLYFEIKYNTVFPLISAAPLGIHIKISPSPLISTSPLNAALIRIVIILLVAN